jgi:hypothetical protein
MITKQNGLRWLETTSNEPFYPPLMSVVQGGPVSTSRGGKTMYDNSASLALTGSGITILGQTASLTAVTIGGALFVGVGAVLALGERLKRRRDGS